MRIDFKRIEMRNFMSFAEEAFDFSQCTGMNLVQGKNNDIPGAKNGCGKSNLFAALLYVLFGQLQSKIKNENVVNKYSRDKDMLIVLTFSVDGEQYKVRRGLAKGKSSYLELLKIDSSGIESDITKSTIPETQSFIEKDLIHCDIALFLRTMLLTADQTYNFYMLKKADKKEFVEKLFDISVFEDMYKALHKDSLSLDKESAICQNKMLMLGKSNEDYALRRDKHEESRKARMKVLSESISSLEKKLELAKQEEVKSNAEAVSKLERAIEKIDQEVSESRKKYEDAYEELQSVNAKKSQIDLGIHKIAESKASRQKVIDKHKDILEKLCADCKHVFMKHYSLDKMLEEVKDFDAKSCQLLKAQDGTAAKARELSTSIETAKLEHAASKDKASRARAKMKELLEESTRASKALSKLEIELEDEKSRLDHEENAANPYVELIEKCKKDLETESKSLSAIEEKLRYVKCAESIVSQDTLRKFIIKDLVVLLNNKIKTYLTKLGANYYVVFDEDMDYTFIAPSGTYEWSNFSAGERMRIMVATSFAFRDFMSIRNGLNANILVLDEYFDSAIDTLCVESILQILKDYSTSQNQNIFVISHRPEVSPEQFDRTILVEKTSNIATVKVA